MLYNFWERHNYRVGVMSSGMCLGLGEWWLHKGVVNLQNLVIFNLLARISISIHADILVLVSEFCSGGHFI